MDIDCITYVNNLAARLTGAGVQFDRTSLSSLVKDEIFCILQPTISIKQSIRQYFGSAEKISFDSCMHLEAVVQKRIEMKGDFLHMVSEAILAYKPDAVTGHGKKMRSLRPIQFKALTADSHNGGMQPLAIKDESGTIVLKFADPRPYQVTAEILTALSSGIGVDIIPPAIFPDLTNRWYFIEYLDEDAGVNNDIGAYMFAMGAMTAVAFCLRFVDIHLENLIAFNGKPVIIDPECIFYNFDGNANPECLLDTGLLGNNAYFSSLRGGVSPGVPFFDFDLHIEDDGILRYRKPSRVHRNRIRRSNGSFADPSEYRKEVINGYSTAYRWFVANTDEICDIIQDRVTNDFRVRFLSRQTSHYASVIHMLNLPNTDNYPLWVDDVLTRFRASDHLSKSISPEIIAAELMDIENRDIPYFWVNAGEKNIRHRSGVVHSLETELTVRAQAIQDIQNLREEDLNAQIKILEEFLDIDLTKLPMEAARE